MTVQALAHGHLQESPKLKMRQCLSPNFGNLIRFVTSRSLSARNAGMAPFLFRIRRMYDSRTGADHVSGAGLSDLRVQRE